MTRRRTIPVVLLGGAAVLLPLLLLVGLVRSVLPSSAQARDSAQEAADRLAPGQLTVTSARWLGEAGGYQVVATLADPATTLSWTGDKRCAPGSVCEERLRVQLATVRDGAAETAAVRRAFSACGVAVVEVTDVRYDPTAMLLGRREILASLTVVVPAAELDGPARRGTTDRLDACVLAWDAGRDGLLPVTGSRTTLTLADTDGTVHSSTGARVDHGRLRGSAGDAVVPVLGAARYSALRAAVDPTVRAFLVDRGVAVKRIEDVRCSYAAGTTGRLDLEVTVSQEGADPLASLPTRGVLLTVDRDGGDPTDLRLA